MRCKGVWFLHVLDLVLAGISVVPITPPVEHSEEPSWDPRIGVLYYIEVYSGTIFRYEYKTGNLTSIQLSSELGPVIQVKNNVNLLVVGLGLKLVAIDWNGHNPAHVRYLTSVSRNMPFSQFNDGKADKEGRLWFGTKGFYPDVDVYNQGVLYQFTCANYLAPEVKIAPVNISNGLTWNKANNRFFYIDSQTKIIAGYTFNSTTGDISNREVVFDVSKHNKLSGIPDGMTIDSDDNLWVALYKGGEIIHVNSRTGELLRVMRLPIKYITSVMFGGPNLDVLFATTSKYLMTDEQRRVYPFAGSVLEISGLGVKGVPVFQTNLLTNLNDEIKCK